MEGIKRSLLFALFLIMCTLVQAQRLTVQGKVVSKTDGESIIGATVIETNQTSNGTITDIDGNFTLSVPQGAELSISYIGFKTVNVKAQATLNIVVPPSCRFIPFKMAFFPYLFFTRISASCIFLSFSRFSSSASGSINNCIC